MFHTAAVMVLFGAMLGFTGSVGAQSFPSKPLRIVTAEIGSSNDIAARQIAQGLTASLGQQVLVDNRGVLASILPRGRNPMVIRCSCTGRRCGSHLSCARYPTM